MLCAETAPNQPIRCAGWKDSLGGGGAASANVGPAAGADGPQIAKMGRHNPPVKGVRHRAFKSRLRAAYVRDTTDAFNAHEPKPPPSHVTLRADSISSSGSTYSSRDHYQRLHVSPPTASIHHTQRHLGQTR